MVAAKGEPGWVFYYDGNCGFCAWSVRLLALADLFRKVAWMDFQKLSAPPDSLTWADLDAAAWLEVKRSLRQPHTTEADRPRFYQGFYAVRMLALRLPPLFPLAPLLWLPGANRLGEAAYAWIAANRYRISRRCRLKTGP